MRKVRKHQVAPEENTADRLTAGKDCASAVVIGTLAIIFVAMSLRLEVPGSIYTAPGMFPFIVSLMLLIMAVSLGARAVRHGGIEDVLGRSVRAVKNYVSDEEGCRTIMLMGMVVIYVLLVAFITFDLRITAFFIDFRLTSYEVISVVVIGLVLRVFWRASLARCALVSLVMIEALASVFRYGFGMIMPEAF